MEEKIISLETALLAKEKKCQIGPSCYFFEAEPTNEDKVFIEDLNLILNFEDFKEDLRFPTQNLLKEYLKKNHNIFIIIKLDMTSYPKFCYEIWKYLEIGNFKQIYERKLMFLYQEESEALEDALKEALKQL